MTRLERCVRIGAGIAVPAVPIYWLLSVLGGHRPPGEATLDAIGFGVTLGALCGLSEGWLLRGVDAWFTTVSENWTWRRRPASVALAPGEHILKKGSVQRLTRPKASGWLLLTNRQLVFQAKEAATEARTPLADVAEAREFAIVQVLPYGLQVHGADGAVERFFVSGSDRWVAAIEAALEGLQRRE